MSTLYRAAVRLNQTGYTNNFFLLDFKSSRYNAFYNPDQYVEK